MIERLAVPVPEAAPVQIVDDLALWHAVGVELKHLPDVGRPLLIKNEVSVFGAVPERDAAADEFSLAGALNPAAPDLLRELERVIFGAGFQHGLQDDRFRIVADLLHCGEKLDAVLLELVFVDGAVVPVPGEAVQFVNDHKLEGLLPGVVDHLLELRPVIGAAGDRSVDVLADHGVPMPPGVIMADMQLPFDALFVLAVRGISSIDHSVIVHRNLRTKCNNFVKRLKIIVKYAILSLKEVQKWN